jgi:preprotein translocase subunit YajC
MRKIVTGLSAWAMTSGAAFADGMGAPQQSSLPSFLMLGALLLVFYFMLIRPQMKRSKEQRELMNSLEMGDEVMTTSGIYGKVTKVDESTVNLTIANGVEIKLQKQAIANMLPKGSVIE